MKKLMAVLVVLMMVGATPGFSLMATAERIAIDNRVDSDLRVERDLGRMLKFVKDDLVMKPLHMVTKPVKPVLDPVFKVTDHILKAPIKIVNGTYDLATKHIPGYKK